jgi:hypothetical protein
LQYGLVNINIPSLFERHNNHLRNALSFFGYKPSYINTLMQSRRGQQSPLKAFISYAWEGDGTPLEDKDANAKLQRWLERLRDDLQLAGISVSLDIGDMHGQMLGVAGSAARASHFPAFSKVRMQQNLHVILTITEAITDEMKAYLIRDCRQEENYEHVLITSRSQQWRNIVTVDSFSAEETLACVQKQLPHASPQDAQALGKAVNYLPLALSQAVAYIYQNKPISILSYLTLYEKKGINGRLRQLKHPPVILLR